MCAAVPVRYYYQFHLEPRFHLEPLTQRSHDKYRSTNLRSPGPVTTTIVLCSVPASLPHRQVRWTRTHLFQLTVGTQLAPSSNQSTIQHFLLPAPDLNASPAFAHHLTCGARWYSRTLHRGYWTKGNSISTGSSESTHRTVGLAGSLSTHLPDSSWYLPYPL